MKLTATTLLTIAIVCGVLTFMLFTHQVKASVGLPVDLIVPVLAQVADVPPVPTAQANKATDDIRRIVEIGLVIIGGLTTLVSAVSAFLVILFGKIKELRGTVSEVQGVVNKTQDQLVDIALKTPVPNTTDNTINISAPTPAP